MGSVPSARRIQPGGPGPAAAGVPRTPPPSPPRRPRVAGSGPGLAAPRPGRSRPPQGAFPPRRCAATGPGSAGKAQGGKVAGGEGGRVRAAAGRGGGDPSIPSDVRPGRRQPPPRLYSPLPAAARIAVTRGRGRRPPPRPPPAEPSRPAAPPSGGGGPAGRGGGTGPPAPGAAVNRGGLPSVRPSRACAAEAGGAHATPGAPGVSGDVGVPPDPS